MVKIISVYGYDFDGSDAATHFVKVDGTSFSGPELEMMQQAMNDREEVYRKFNSAVIQLGPSRSKLEEDVAKYNNYRELSKEAHQPTPDFMLQRFPWLRVADEKDIAVFSYGR